MEHQSLIVLEENPIIPLSIQPFIHPCNHSFIHLKNNIIYFNIPILKEIEMCINRVSALSNLDNLVGDVTYYEMTNE